MEGMPKDITIQELQEKFDAYEATITNIPKKKMRPFKIAKLNIGKPFFLNQEVLKDEELEKMQERHGELIETFVSWIEERSESQTFSVSKENREQIYKEYEELLAKQAEKYKELGEKIEE